ncbi:hypothetical protein NIES4074_55180 [Cylindrospermum sp. NIES-4074]|nr:hypothetical protein NIES4074_55180 [Cylindrospermum sp. NIES-4074]
MNEILVRMLVPVKGINDYANLLYFKNWLPDINNIMTYEKDNMSIKIWFDENCIFNPFSEFEDQYEVVKEAIEEIKNSKQFVDKVYIDIVIHNLSDEIIQFIFEEKRIERKSNDLEYQDLVKEYEILTVNIMESAINVLNKMFIYFRNYKRHYWLLEYEQNDSFGSAIRYIRKFSMKVKSDFYDWVKWDKLTGIRINPGGRLTTQRDMTISLITQEEWTEAKNFIVDNKRIKGFNILKTLANADLLAFEGYHRNALIEGVLALESAIDNFTSNGKYDDLLNLDDLNRLQIEKIQRLIKTSDSLRSKINIIYPLFIKKELIPDDVLLDCQNAIEQRNTIVHKNAYIHKPFEKEKLDKLLGSIRYMCNIFIEYME